MILTPTQIENDFFLVYIKQWKLHFKMTISKDKIYIEAE